MTLQTFITCLVYLGSLRSKLRVSPSYSRVYDSTGSAVFRLPVSCGHKARRRTSQCSSATCELSVQYAWLMRCMHRYSGSTTSSQRTRELHPTLSSVPASLRPKHCQSDRSQPDQRNAPSSGSRRRGNTHVRRLYQYDSCRHRYSTGTGSLHAVGSSRETRRARPAAPFVGRVHAMQCTCKLQSRLHERCSSSHVLHYCVHTTHVCSFCTSARLLEHDRRRFHELRVDCPSFAVSLEAVRRLVS